jgi:catechol 2,3-dioxygenase-like lactoylglutathione lyase family enzyme
MQGSRMILRLDNPSSRAMQLDHVSVYVHDVQTSRQFYDAILLPFGWEMVRDFEAIAVGYGHENYAEFALVREKREIRSAHVAFRVDERSDVDTLYSLALEAGANNNGLPGLRPHYHACYYAAFVLDPDGHNLEFVCHTAAVGEN